MITNVMNGNLEIVLNNFSEQVVLLVYQQTLEEEVKIINIIMECLSDTLVTKVLHLVMKFQELT